MSWLIHSQRPKDATSNIVAVDRRKRLAQLRATNPTAFLENLPESAGGTSNEGTSPAAAAARTLAGTVAVARVASREARKKHRKSFAKDVVVSATVLGSGAYGVVYIGVHQTTGGMVAVKKIQMRPQGAQSGAVKSQLDDLVEEIRLMKALDHPNIVKYLDAEHKDTELCIYMEFMSGGSLSTMLKRFTKLPEAMIRVYMLQAVQGVAYLHQKNVVHRDIKADNILLHSDGVAKLSDFGTSREVSDSANLLTVTGTPWFMAPEVVKGTGHGASADIWSIGCTMIQLASGTVPFSEYSNPVTAMYHVALHPSKVMEYIPAECSPQLRHCIEWCLQESPSSRPSAAALAEHPFFTVDTTNVVDTEDGRSTSSESSIAPQSKASPIDGILQRIPSRPTTPISRKTSRLRDETQNQQVNSAVAMF